MKGTPNMHTKTIRINHEITVAISRNSPVVYAVYLRGKMVWRTGGTL